ncbi:class I SAM-dependent methyltransferase [Baaleninema simplex]|uniref:class I SAM-dependent methyltransferase n=1 Tax=Baaleninema simplex TaxID=2862350 RepID=UPI0008FC195F|nr:class I SAM-dependent methyltransferase [Baaleninema simplex]
MSSVKSIARSVVPAPLRQLIGKAQTRYRRSIKTLRFQAQQIRYIGDNVVCPCCNGHFREFRTAGVGQRPNAQCPRCTAMERHRLLWLYLQQRTNLFTDRLKVLHIAPEKIFYHKFIELDNLDYLTADLDSSLAMVKMDITDIQYDDNSFDVVLCNHVLEHIPNDRQAMRELCRVLKPGGWAILQVPLDLDRDETFEDPSVESPEERERLFGQKDHVRWYGKDYADRLQEAGFTVKIDPFVRELDEAIVKRYALLPHHDVYYCTKTV